MKEMDGYGSPLRSPLRSPSVAEGSGEGRPGVNSIRLLREDTFVMFYGEPDGQKGDIDDHRPGQQGYDFIGVHKLRELISVG